MAANIYDYLEACGHKPDAAPDGKSGLGMGLTVRLRARSKSSGYFKDFFPSRCAALSRQGDTFSADAPPLICVNLRMNMYPQITQIYADEYR